ncbi:hypothetical protein [Mucilaginibacter flavidus]|uniref:hypothetical protein n=1 Tax=Mucilaginibacter flavidus TaxID=2949309 RepID=UPI002092B9FB|nr:hypothetical protein [Mucilaginibacter flavidus]MCO5948532.1 hypothetical protein [Mucilaginibacter flavidus]
MANFEIAIMDNVNVPKLMEILNGLNALGCHISIKGPNFLIEYDDNLQEDVTEFFEMDYKNKP